MRGCGLDPCGSGKGNVEDFFEHGDESSGSINLWKSKILGKWPLPSLKIWQGNTKAGLREIRRDDARRIKLFQDRVQWRGSVLVEPNLRVVLPEIVLSRVSR
jgi:hypothetical protein